MFDLILNKFSYGINLCQFKIGDFLFPILEPFCRILENRNSEVRRHFQRALKSLERQDFNVALLNLNMVLSLHPNHFLARVYRARVYVRWKQFRLAVEDYVQASQTNRFRFIHYHLYRECFIPMNLEPGDMNVPISNDFDQAYKIMKLRKDLPSKFSEYDSQALDNSEKSEKSYNDYEEVCFLEDLIFTEKDRIKFSQLGPITRKEIDATDWKILSKELSSKTREA